MPAYAYRRKPMFKRTFKKRSGYTSKFRGGKTYGPRKNGTWAYKPFTTTAPAPSLRCNTRIVKSPDDILPDRLFVPLRYVVTIPNTVSVTGETFWIKLNSPYDCGDASDNTSAYGYTRLVTLFQRSRCWGSKIKVTVNMGSSVSALSTAVISVFPTNVYTAKPTIGGYQEGAEQPFAVTVECQDTVATAQGVQRTLQNQMGTIKANGLSKTAFVGDANYTAVPNSDPAFVCYWGLRWDNSGGSLSAGDIRFMIQVEYLVEFFARLNYDPALQTQAPAFVNEDNYFDVTTDMKDDKSPTLAKLSLQEKMETSRSIAQRRLSDNKAKSKEKEKEPQRGAEGPPRRESVPRGGSLNHAPVPAIIKKPTISTSTISTNGQQPVLNKVGV